ncbi:hypothetical protein VQ03_00290 [Methylobacterium tarhaniae]|uniref:Uncharacterized protein n=1 Tax=Methylobacterium tarhaniae TaxID=1187852 RepID=A0A0J6TGA5_9HYPH|nr:hypothetical protein VQ03_00290 [Methylobacterium tarhaniae]
MQRTPVLPPLDPGRDAVALSSPMGFGVFQAWMRQLLSGALVRDGGRRCDRYAVEPVIATATSNC